MCAVNMHALLTDGLVTQVCTDAARGCVMHPLTRELLCKQKVWNFSFCHGRERNGRKVSKARRSRHLRLGASIGNARCTMWLSYIRQLQVVSTSANLLHSFPVGLGLASFQKKRGGAYDLVVIVRQGVDGQDFPTKNTIGVYFPCGLTSSSRLSVTQEFSVQQRSSQLLFFESYILE